MSNSFNCRLRFLDPRPTYRYSEGRTLFGIEIDNWVLSRLEKVNLRRAPGLAKVVGTVVTVTGAMVMTLYKGPILEMVWSRGTNHDAPKSSDVVKQDWVRGSLMITFGSFCWSCFIILQVSYLIIFSYTKL